MSVDGCAEAAVDVCGLCVLGGGGLTVVDGCCGSVVGCCGSAVVFVPVVPGGSDVVDTWASVVELKVVTTAVVNKSVYAVDAIAVVEKVDCV